MSWDHVVRMYSRLSRTPPEPAVSLASYPLPYLQMESEAGQRRMWKRVAKRGPK